jgi:alkaline phosphatase D
MRILLICLLLLSSAPSFSQLASGPMLGYCEIKESLIWLQTDGAAEVRIVYWEGEKVDSLCYTSMVQTNLESAYTAKLLAFTKPGLTYYYRVQVDGTLMPSTFQLESQPLWQYRIDPPAFTLATGSCTYINEPEVDRPGKPYGAEYKIFESIAEKKPDVMLWLGDNIYLREVDFNSKSSIHHRYSHMRKLPELQNLLHAFPHYAIWDDHDFGPNDSDRSFIHKEWTEEAFEMFWGNNGFGLPGMPGITGQFTYADVDVFLLDNRYFRCPQDVQNENRSILGDSQTEWLIEALKYSRAPFKLVAVGGQFLSDMADYENHANYPEERDYILKRLNDEGIEGVIFLTGDRHHTELSSLCQMAMMYTTSRVLLLRAVTTIIQMKRIPTA